MATTPISNDLQKSLSAATGGTQNKIAADKDTFLKLLIAQLTHQDPMNPTEDKEFVAQLAQFTSVEELQKIHTGIEKLNSSQAQQQVVNAVSLVGKSISAKGDSITKATVKNDKGEEISYVSTLYATLTSPVKSCTINVYKLEDNGKPGSLVFSEALGPRQAGDVSYTWEGKDSFGKEAPNGRYMVTISGVKENGSQLLIETNSEGVVRGVKASADGNHELYLTDGRSVRFNDISIITQPVVADKDKKPGDDGTGTGGGGTGTGGGGTGTGGGGTGTGGGGTGSGK